MFKRASVAQKVYLGLVIPVGILLVIVFYGVQFLKTVTPALRSSAVAHGEFVVFAELKTISSATSVTVGTYALSGGRLELEKRYDNLSLQLDEALKEAATKVTDAEAVMTLKQFNEKIQNLRGVELLIVTETKAGNKDKASQLLEEYYLPAQTEALGLLDAFSEKHSYMIGQATEDLLTQSEQVVRMVTIVLLPLIIAIALILYLILWLFVQKPIRNLSEVTERIQHDDFTARAKVFYQDEIGSLATAFNAMADTVLVSQKAIRDQLTERTEQVQKIDFLLKQQKEAVASLKLHEDELAKANEQLRKLDSIKSEFVTVAAHQLRTPLTSIKWAYEELLNQQSGQLSEDQKKIVQDGFQSSVNAIRIINDLLDLARIEEGRSQYVFLHQSIVPLVVTVGEQFSKVASYKKISFESKFESHGLPDLSFDSEKLLMALENILDNAIKYTQAGGKVVFSLEHDVSGVRISVRDTGIGIPKNQQGNLFTKFFRGSNAMLVQTDGSGLGLYVAKRVVEDHGGTIMVSSEEKKGTTVTIVLPIPKKA